MGTATINSNAYVLGITKATAIQDIYKTVYNRIVNNVIDPHSSTRAKWWYSAFPDADIDNAAAYPIGIINDPNIAWENFTFTKKQLMAEVVIEIYSTSAREMSNLADQIINAMEISRSEFRGAGLTYVNLDGTGTDFLMRDKIKVHIKTMTFTCQFLFTQTKTY